MAEWRQLATWHPQSGSRERWMLVLSLGPNLIDGAAYTRGGSSTSLNISWKHPHRHTRYGSILMLNLIKLETTTSYRG